MSDVFLHLRPYITIILDILAFRGTVLFPVHPSISGCSIVTCDSYMQALYRIYLALQCTASTVYH